MYFALSPIRNSDLSRKLRSRHCAYEFIRERGNLRIFERGNIAFVIIKSEKAETGTAALYFSVSGYIVAGLADGIVTNCMSFCRGIKRVKFNEQTSSSHTFRKFHGNDSSFSSEAF